jgi:glycosyltransferase involved in cell wall biosynthesis
VIHNGVDPARLAAGDARGLRAQLGIGDGDVVFAVVGSLIPRKGIAVVIRALRALRERRRDCHVLVCGDGPVAAELRALAAAEGVGGAVHFLGRRADVGAVLRDATDVLVSAAWEESFGLAVAEAASLGVPAIATEIDGHVEVVDDGVSGVLFRAGDAAALADAMAALAADPNRRRAMGAAAKRRAGESFSVTRYVSEFAALYERLFAAPRAGYGWGGPWGRSAIYTRWAAAAVGRRLARLRPGARGASASAGRDGSGAEGAW